MNNTNDMKNIIQYLKNVGIDPTKITKEQIDMLSSIDLNNINETKANEILNNLGLNNPNNPVNPVNPVKPVKFEYKNIRKRNESCYCGSQKKYKKCCINVPIPVESPFYYNYDTSNL